MTSKIQACDTPSTIASVPDDDDIEIVELGTPAAQNVEQSSRTESRLHGGTSWAINYFSKIKGRPKASSPPSVPLSSTFFNGLFSFIGIFAVSFISHHGDAASLVIASFGASAVLIYDSIDSPLAQPRNVVGGQVISALVGVSIFKLFRLGGEENYYEPAAAAGAVSVAIVCMDLTKTLHPPGGATALIAVISDNDVIRDIGYLYVVYPVGLGVTIMLSLAILLNNIVGTRSYPKYWW